MTEDVSPAPDVRVLAFYLPQFHPTPENDAWWGRGFTEWTNVVAARPYFDGHYQPHVPGELGFYDLRLEEVREQQAQLARAHGVSGFCYYHYWFHGRTVLDRPLREVRERQHPDFPFCILWANENWTRTWDAGDDQVLIEQRYSPEDDRRHGEHLAETFGDPRYIRVQGRPLFLVYRLQSLPDARRTLDLWREQCAAAGVGDPYVVGCESHGYIEDPALLGADATVEFHPHLAGPAVDTAVLSGCHPGNRVYRYRDLVEAFAERPADDWSRYPCVLPGWDNSPRRPDGRAAIVTDSTPELFEQWMRKAVERACREQPDDPIVFVNAWNEWAEGAHLEPDVRHGRAYLEAVAAVTGTAPAPGAEAARDIDAVQSARWPETYRALYDQYLLLQDEHAELRAMVDRRISAERRANERRVQMAREQALAIATHSNKLREVVDRLSSDESRRLAVEIILADARAQRAQSAGGG